MKRIDAEIVVRKLRHKIFHEGGFDENISKFGSFAVLQDVFTLFDNAAKEVVKELLSDSNEVVCGICHTKIRSSPSGDVCENGHGDCPVVPAPMPHEESGIQIRNKED